MRRPRSHAVRPVARPLSVTLERLEDRRLLATFALNGTNLAIDLTAKSTLSVTTSGEGNYSFSLSGDTFSGTDASGLTGNGTNALAVTSALDLSGVSITNSAGTTAVLFTDSATSYVDNFTVNMKGLASDGAWVPSVKFTGKSAFSAAAALDVTAPTIAVEGGTVSTDSGALTLEGVSDVPFAGNYSGVTLTKASTVSSASGALVITGQGGTDATGNQNGVSVEGGSTIEAGASTSQLTIVGRGGTVSGDGPSNHGILLQTGSVIDAERVVLLDGTGGGSGSNSNNRGVFVSGVITATGGSSTLTVNGKGGGGTGSKAQDNDGVYIGNQAMVTADDRITVTGTAGAGTATAVKPYLSSSGLVLNSAHVSTSSSETGISFNADSFKLQGPGTAIASNGEVAFKNTVDGLVMPLDKPANAVLTRTYAKSIVYGTKTAVIEQDVAAAGGALQAGTADLTLAGSKINLRSDVRSGGALTVNGPVVLGVASLNGGVAAGDVTLTGNGVTFTDTVDGAKNLTLASPSAPIKFSAALGKTTALASLAVKSASSVTAASTVAVDGSAAGAAKNGLWFDPGVKGIDMQVPGSTIANAGGHGIVLRATSNSSLAGFTIKNPGVSGIHAAGAMPATKITASRVDGGGKAPYGVFLADTTGLSLGTAGAGNTIGGTTVGIVAKGDLTGASIRANAVDGNTAGIALQAARGAQVVGNRISGKQTQSYGIRAEGDNSAAVVSGNVITGSTYGILLDNARKMQVGGATKGAGNVVQAGLTTSGGAYEDGRTSYGLRATGDLAGTTVVGNSITDNTVGISLADARNLTVRDGNLVYRSRSQGIAVSGTSTSTTIRGTTVDGSLPDGTRAPLGIVLSAATGLVVGGDADAEANGVYSTTTAVFAGGTLTGSALKRTIIRSVANGIALGAAQGLWVQSNDVTGATQQGLNASGDCTGTTVLFNRLQLGASGMVIDAARSLAVKHNVIESNRAVGLFATGTCTGTKVSDNAIVRNGVNLATSTATGGWFQPS